VTTNLDHPSYPFPTVAEALCEVHFQLSQGQAWKPSLPGVLFKGIQNEFPEMEPALELGVQLELGPQGVAQKVLPPRQRTRFKHATRPLLLQLGENVFTVNLLPKYPGWDTMREDVLKAWKQAQETLQPAKVTRIGLRYINRIERESQEDRPANWLKPTDYIPPGVLTSEPGFLSRVEARLDNENRIIVTLGFQPEGHHGAIVLDIDRIVEKELPPDVDALGGEMNRLHEDVWYAFNSAKGEKLERLLVGGKK
jgi:uncharacterized protein (TIGR04255 family)